MVYKLSDWRQIKAGNKLREVRLSGTRFNIWIKSRWEGSYNHVSCTCMLCFTAYLVQQNFHKQFFYFFYFLLKTQLLYYQNNKTKNLWYSRTFLIFYYVSNAIRSVYKGGNQVSISSLVSIHALSSIINNKEVYVFIVIGLTRCSRILVDALI